MEDKGKYFWVPYKEWLANIPNPRYGIAAPFPYVVKHYTPGQEATSYSHAVTLLRNIWNFHTYSAEGDGWGWIGYNTLQYGKYIFEGAGIGNRGIHAPGANGQSHGHAFLISERQVTDEEWIALRAFLTDVVNAGVLAPAVLYNGDFFTNHKDWISTTCPGPVASNAQRFYELANQEPKPEPKPEPVVNEDDDMHFELRTDINDSPWAFEWNYPKENIVFAAGAGCHDAVTREGDIIEVHLNGKNIEVPLHFVVLEQDGKQHFYTITRFGEVISHVPKVYGWTSVITHFERVRSITCERRKVK